MFMKRSSCGECEYPFDNKRHFIFRIVTVAYSDLLRIAVHQPGNEHNPKRRHHDQKLFTDKTVAFM